MAPAQSPSNLPLLFLMVALPALIGLLVAFARIGWAMRWSDNLNQCVVTKYTDLKAGPSTWMRDIGKILLWPFKAVFGQVDSVAEAPRRAGLRIVVFLYLLMTVVAIVLLVLYVVIVVTLAVAALYIGYKVLTSFGSHDSKEEEEHSQPSRGGGYSAVREPAPRRDSVSSSLWSSTVACRACGATVSTDVTTCPQCQEDLSQFKLFGASPVECRSCHATVSEDTSVCPQCGEDLERFKLLGASPQTCRSCQASISEDESVCPQCGEDQERFKLFGASPGECRSCGATISEDVPVCHQCGENHERFKLFGASPVTCRACEATVSEDAKRCPQCGEDLVAFKLFG